MGFKEYKNKLVDAAKTAQAVSPEDGRKAAHAMEDYHRKNKVVDRDPRAMQAGPDRKSITAPDYTAWLRESTKAAENAAKRRKKDKE